MPRGLIPGEAGALSAFRPGIIAVSLLLVLAFCAGPLSAQNTSQAPVDEIVANLAAGRVIIAVVKDAIIIGTIENPVEAETRPPTPVALGSERTAVMLGPVYWFSPSSQLELANLDTELPHIRNAPTSLGVQAPHLQGTQEGHEANDIEAIGQGLLDRLNSIAKGLRGKVDTPSKGPLAELILADYLPQYGPEVWQLTYEMKQVEEERDYWDTHFLHPTYSQFWPPEKGQPRTLIEFNYPLEGSPATLLELLREQDPRVEKIRSASPIMAQVSDMMLQGESNKVLSSDAIPYLRAIMGAIAPPDARQTMAVIGQESGLHWIIAPPPETHKNIQQAASQSGAPPEERPADAPSLLHPPSH